MFSKSFFLCLKAVLLLGAVIALAFASFASAQTDPARTVVDGYIAAQHRLDWKTVASYVSPAELSEFKKLFRSILDGAPGPIDTSIVRPASFGKKSAAEVASADSVSYFAGIFSTVFELYPVMRDMATTARDSVLGSVSEGTDMRHFVCRVNVTTQQEKLSNIEVVSLRKTNGKWCVMIKRSMEQMAALLKRSIR